MKIEIINRPLNFNIYGFSGTIENQDYGGTGMKLMDKMWAVVKGLRLKNKGINVWVYENGMKMMCGVELETELIPESGLENRKIIIAKYAYWKHIGSYHLLKQVNKDMRAQLESMKIEYQHPCIEIYGHHQEDVNKIETEIIWSVV